MVNYYIFATYYLTIVQSFLFLYLTDLDVCKICLKKHKDFVHSLNVWHVKVLDAAFEAAIAVSKWGEALDYGKQLLPGFR